MIVIEEDVRGDGVSRRTGVVLGFWSFWGNPKNPTDNCSEGQKASRTSAKHSQYCLPLILVAKPNTRGLINWGPGPRTRGLSGVLIRNHLIFTGPSDSYIRGDGPVANRKMCFARWSFFEDERSRRTGGITPTFGDNCTGSGVKCGRLNPY